ncbi:conserved hypothetical protein [Leishmania mexicana MHOM/GT/2001/U1103]|uniref:Uncharacterized protein n=1 Tax=Leishmania mexicana (strain MHOM/GT/2001/U1103) TaxID=929439 RepID=E9AXK4_LEIMU|nr:conserved hypothetical protein [Leishmania mexicana MHOM/GT/2001/U1103]CBZ27695.1 conserved hypothetical protein [Leishmania mexicana MHOM/GT/2001/U1103]
MLLSKQPGDTGIYATATSSQVRLYYVLDRVFPFASSGAVAAGGSGMLGSVVCDGFDDVGASTTTRSVKPVPPDLMPYFAGAPACVPREYLRMLCRLSAVGRGTGSVAAATASGIDVRAGGYDAYGLPAPFAMSASRVRFPPPPRTSVGYASATSAASDDWLQQEQQKQDVNSAYHWGAPLVPFHTVPCGGGVSAGEGRLFSSHGGANASPQEWATPTVATAGATSTFAEEYGPGQSSGRVSGNSAAGYSGYHAGSLQALAGRAGGGGGGGARTSSTASAAAVPPAPTALSLSCATDCVLFFVANAEGLSWIGRSDATTLSPLRVSMSLPMRRRGTDGYGGPPGGGSGGGTVVSSARHPPRPFSEGFGAPVNATFPANSFASSEQTSTPPNTAGDCSLQNAPLMVSDGYGDEGGDENRAGEAVAAGTGGGGVANSRRRPSLTGAAGPCVTDGLDVYGGAAPAAVVGLPTRRPVSRHDRVVTASGWDPRNSAILALGRQSGAVQLLDVEYVLGSVEGRCCSSTTTSVSTSNADTNERFFVPAVGGIAAGASALGGSSVGGTRLVPYAGADHLSYSVVQQKQLLGPVTALDWMPQSHLTVVAARRLDGLGFYAELLDLRASHDGVTYLGAPPEVFGVPVYARTRDNAAPCVLCSAEQVACHPSQRYVATVGASQMRDIVQLWDVRMATRPVSCQVYARAGYTSLCWSATEAGVVLGTTRDGGLRAHTFKALAPSRAAPSGPVVVTSHHYGSAANPHLSPSGFGSGGAGGGFGAGRSRQRRAPSGGLPHHRSPSGGELEADRWGVINSNPVNSGCSGTEAEAEEDFSDGSCSTRSGFSGDGTGTTMPSITDGSNALVHVSVKAQSALKCRLPSRVPAAAVGCVCHPLSESMRAVASGSIPGLASVHRSTGGGMSAAGPHHSELLHASHGATSGLRPTDDCDGEVDDNAMARGCRTDLPQLLLLNAKNGELYTQVYNPGGSTVTSLSSSTALVGAGPNAFLTHTSTAYNTTIYAYEEAVLDRLECQAAAASAAPGMAVPSCPTPTSFGSASKAGMGLLGGRAGVAGAATVTSTNKPHVSGDSTTGGAQLSSTGSSATGGGRACAAAARGGGGGRGGVAAAAARQKGRPMDLIGLGLLDEVEDEDDEEEGERDTPRARAGAASTGDYEHCVLAGANANEQQSGFGAASSTAHGLLRMGAAGTAGVGDNEGSPSSGSPRAGLSREAASSVVGSGGAAAPKGPKGLHGSGISGALQEKELLGRRSSLREPVAASPHSRSTPAEPMQQPYTGTTSAAGRGAAQSAPTAATPAATSIPQEMSFCEFHRLDRTRHLWRRLRSGFSYDPVRNLTVLLREGLDREAYATFLYGCCAAQLLFPTAVMVAPKSRGTDQAAGLAASAPSLVVGLKRAVPGLLELLVSECELRQQLGLSDTRLSSQFPLSHHHHQLALTNATAAGEAAGFAPPSGYAIMSPIGARGLPAPLLAGLSSAMERHKGPSGFSLHPFSAAAAGIRAGRPPSPAHLPGPAINAGVSRAASSVLRGGAGSPGAAGGAAGDSAAYLPTYPVAIGMLRQLVLESMGWTTPPAVFLVDPPSEHTIEREGTGASAAAARAGGAQATRSPPPRGDHHPRHPAERFFVQGDGIGQRSLQEALERRVAVLVLLDRLEEAAELLALYGTHNAQYPSIALTLSAARGRQTAVMSLAADDCPGVTFWIHLMLTYMELVMHQQSCGAAAAGDRILPADAGSAGRGSDEATSSTATCTAEATEPVSRFDDLFTLPQQKAVVLRLLERYPRLVLSDKVALSTALLLPSRYHSGHIANVMEVLQALVQQQYRDYSTTATASTAAQQAVADSMYGSPSSTLSPLGIRARQQRRVDSKRASLSGLPRSPAQSSSVDVAVSPAALSGRFPSSSGASLPAHGSVDSHYSDPSDTFVLAAAASTASVDRFAPIYRCSLLLVTVVEGVSTDCGALQRYVDESGDVQTPLSYAAAFSNVLSPTVRMWRDAYRRLLNDQGLAMWRSLHDLHIVKLLKAREEADKHGGGSAISGSSNSHSAGAGGGVAGIPGGSIIGGGGGSSPGMVGAGTTRGGGVVGAATGAPPGGPAGPLSSADVPRPSGFPGALGALGSDIGVGPGAASAAAMMSTQTAMMMERTLNRFAQTTATATTDRDRSLREAAGTAGGASPGANEALYRAVELRCNCGQAMHATAPSKSSISSMTSTNMTRKQLIPCGNPECRQWQSPMCTVCGERMEHRATELPPERFFAWCSVCLHGGHWCHLREWFSKHTKCPVENCPCHCCDSVHLS